MQGVLTGGATTIVDYNLTPNKAAISDANGKVSTSSASDIEVGYLVGVNDSIQNQLDSKANQSTTYTKTEVDNELVFKANPSTTYTKAEVDNALLFIADKSTTYTNTEVDTSLSQKLINQQLSQTQTPAIIYHQSKPVKHMQ